MDHPDIIKTLENAGDAPDSPFILFNDWMAEAEKTEPNDPNAMCLATISPEGLPDARIVLLKALDEKGFVFYTNRQSKKGSDLAANPVAALNFYWKTLGRQVHVRGTVEQITDPESDAYFITRPHGSKIGAWASQQSKPLENRSTLETRVQEFENKFKDDEAIPRPPYWGGYRVKPDIIEFWHAGDFRLHTRLSYKRNGHDWKKQMLFP
ncbi:MAG: pyridoxamine 5'-phosphate oxidase [Alphaproteobacteria bacterium CG_4_9_14_3_um_filter_47_13]|nr:MAG: pyridoxamine 5'-phosphate oxidase [Alphaproteobacteria bacterium CG_4_9_14_3_um_filter_47_13]